MKWCLKPPSLKLILAITTLLLSSCQSRYITPATQAEQAAGLTAIQIDQLKVKHNQTDSALYYVYQQPLDPDTEAFLGYAFSESGKKAINSY
jgi:hypothetical protein